MIGMFYGLDKKGNYKLFPKCGTRYLKKGEVPEKGKYKKMPLSLILHKDRVRRPLKKGALVEVGLVKPRENVNLALKCKVIDEKKGKPVFKERDHSPVWTIKSKWNDYFGNSEYIPYILDQLDLREFSSVVVFDPSRDDSFRNVPDVYVMIIASTPHNVQSGLDNLCEILPRNTTGRSIKTYTQKGGFCGDSLKLNAYFIENLKNGPVINDTFFLQVIGSVGGKQYDPRINTDCLEAFVNSAELAWK